MRRNWAAIVLPAGALLVVLFSVFQVHQTSKRNVITQFNENHLLTVQQVARSVERYFHSRSQDLRWLAYIASQQSFDRDRITAAIRANYSRLKIADVQDVSLLNEEGTVVYSTTAGAEGTNHSRADFFAWARNQQSSGTVRMWYREAEGPRMPVITGSVAPPHMRLSLITPVYRESAGGPQQPGGKFLGAVLFTIDIKKILARRSPLKTSAASSHQLWIIDKDGMLLAHSAHPEMVMKDIRIRDKTCAECHTSFDYIEKILGEPEGTIQYQIKKETKKLAAFTSMSFEDVSWIVVMNTPLDEVTAFESENLKETLLLLGALVFLMGFSFIFAYRNYRQKMAGEMEVKRLQENQALLEKLRRTLGGTIQVISRTVEMRDSYTAGHQRRTADLARAIATEMGTSADQTDFVRIACTIHDIGKIAVPAEILSKPTKLTDIEFGLIKVHPEAGYDILKNVEFPWPVADVILQHHERMDGSGYPRGIKGGDILLESRILAVADVVEAMASHRPYRPSLGLHAALEEIIYNRGTLYDPGVVDICLRLFNEKGYKIVD